MENSAKELKENELEQVVGGQKDDYPYVYLYISGSYLCVKAGYKVNAIHVYCNDSQIRYTREMTAGEVMQIPLPGVFPATYKVTGRGNSDGVSFEYYL